ncbi:MAG: hypothetical protein AAFX01_06885 [Cyanobacteria bacterium J06638_28]
MVDARAATRVSHGKYFNGDPITTVATRPNLALRASASIELVRSIETTLPMIQIKLRF